MAPRETAGGPQDALEGRPLPPVQRLSRAVLVAAAGLVTVTLLAVAFLATPRAVERPAAPIRPPLGGDPGFLQHPPGSPPAERPEVAEQEYLRRLFAREGGGAGGAGGSGVAPGAGRGGSFGLPDDRGAWPGEPGRATAGAAGLGPAGADGLAWPAEAGGGGEALAAARSGEGRLEGAGTASVAGAVGLGAAAAGATGGLRDQRREAFLRALHAPLAPPAAVPQARATAGWPPMPPMDALGRLGLDGDGLVDGGFGGGGAAGTGRGVRAVPSSGAAEGSGYAGSVDAAAGEAGGGHSAAALTKGTAAGGSNAVSGESAGGGAGEAGGAAGVPSATANRPTAGSFSAVRLAPPEPPTAAAAPAEARAQASPATAPASAALADARAQALPAGPGVSGAGGVLAAGTVIPALLLTEVNSDLPGPLMAQVSRDVYDFAQRRVVLRRGTRLLGRYDNQVAVGQRRLLVAWTRLQLLDGTLLDLPGLPGTDRGGAAGLPARVENHVLRIFGDALLLSLLAAGAELSQPPAGSSLAAPSAGSVASAAVGQQLSDAGLQLLRRDLSIQPTLRLPAGMAFTVFVNGDLALGSAAGAGR